MKFSLLLDQNVPQEAAVWIRERRPAWAVYHVNEAGLQGASDGDLVSWAAERQAVIVTFDEDFANAKFYHVKPRPGVVRLRVWPTTTAETIKALDWVLFSVPEDALQHSLIIVHAEKIRIRSY
jgi:predicted nuclease of predicted toxin-antitoxin system